MSCIICLTSSPFFSHFLYYLLNFLPWSLFWNTYHLMSFIYQTSHFPVFSFLFFLSGNFCDFVFQPFIEFYVLFSNCNFKEFSFYSLYFMSLRSLKIWVIISCFFPSIPCIDSELLFSLSIFPLFCRFFGLHLSWWRHSPNVWWSLVALSCRKLSW